MGSGIDRAEDQRERARQRKLAAQKAQAEWEKTTHFTDEGYLNKTQYDWWQTQGAGSYVGEGRIYNNPKLSSKFYSKKPWSRFFKPAKVGDKGTRYWDGTQWSNTPVMAELKPAYNNTSKPGATEDIPESNFSAGTSDVSGDESFAQAGASNIVDRFGLGDTGSPRRKRGRGMSAALGVI